MAFQSEIFRAVEEPPLDDSLRTWIDAFLVDRRARGLADGTLEFYLAKLRLFCEYCNSQGIARIKQLDPTLLRCFLLHLEETGHNAGGQHAAYRTLRAFLRWYEEETELEGWKNPIRKVKAPKVPVEPLEPVAFEDVTRMVRVCERGTFAGCRDAAILLCLLDTGARAGEFLAVNLNDVNQALGDVLIREGKGRNPRTVYLGKKSRRALRAYLGRRRDQSPALWVTEPRYGCSRLTYWGLRSMMARRADAAGVEVPSLHDFRRAFALAMLRNGTDVFTLAKLMGHETITILQRYLKQTTQDTAAAHWRAGPVDNASW